MVNRSRIAIYEYLSEIFSVVTENLYSMTEPIENTASDTENGFLMIKVGSINDESEFIGESYAWARCYVTAYVPKKTRGRLNKALYKSFEDKIEAVIKSETESPPKANYGILEDSILSYDDDEGSNKGNQFHIFVKSFVVMLNQPNE